MPGKIEHPYQFELAGTAFGRFQRLLDGFEADKLYEVIPRFPQYRVKI